MDLAEGSGTDLNTATTALSSVMQAYGIKAAGASQASDVLFNSSRLTWLERLVRGGDVPEAGVVPRGRRTSDG